LTFTTESPDSFHATAYTLRDSTAHQTLFTTGTDFTAAGVGPTGDGLLPRVFTPPKIVVDAARSGFTAGSTTTMKLRAAYAYGIPPGGLSDNMKRLGYPDDLRIEFSDTVVDTGIVIPNSSIGSLAPARFRVIAETAQGDVPLDFGFRDVDRDSSFNRVQERIVVVTYAPGDTIPVSTWTITIDTLGTVPHAGDVYRLRLIRPFNVTDQFTFTTAGAQVANAGSGFAEKPYVVPNPYVGSASFEPARFAVSGRGERRMEFRAIPLGSTIRIYTVSGSLVQTLHQDGSTNGYVPWNLRTKDNLDVAPGLYVFHVDAPGVGTTIGKFAIIK